MARRVVRVVLVVFADWASSDRGFLEDIWSPSAVHQTPARNPRSDDVMLCCNAGHKRGATPEARIGKCNLAQEAPRAVLATLPGPLMGQECS